MAINMDNTQLRQAILSIKSGDKMAGRKLLLSILKEDPNNETALLWLSVTTTNPARKRQCFEQVLRINPGNEVASRELAKLNDVPEMESPASQTQTKPKKKTANALLVVLVIIMLFCVILPYGFSALNNITREDFSSTPSPTRNLTPYVPDPSTRTPVPTPTPTKMPRRVSPSLAKARWGDVDIRDLVKRPDKYIGSEVHYKGEVLTIGESTDGSVMQVWVNIPGGSEFDREAVVIFFTGNTDPIYRGTRVEFWGYCTGSIEGVNAFGSSVSQPSVLVEYLTYFR